MRRVQQAGFTLIEMLVVAPIVILAIGAFLTVIISMTGEVLSSRATNALSYDVQDALDQVERDVKLSTTFLAQTNIELDVADKQGFNYDATPFTNHAAGATGTSLILNMLATDGNPITTSANLVYLANAPNDCSSELLQDNTPMQYNVVYFVKDGSLWRRTIMPQSYADGSSYSCSSAWQQPSCNPSNMSAFCKTNDEELVKGVSAGGFFVEYFTAANNATANTTASSSTDTTARSAALSVLPTARVSISAIQTVAGRTIERSGSVRSTRLETNASTLPTVIAATIPAAPTVTSNISAPTTVDFSWPKVDGATSYDVQYRVNSGGWSSVVNQTGTSYSVSSATHQDTVYIQVAARNSAGASSNTSTSTVVPLWAKFAFQNTWNDYGPPWDSSGYTKTSAGQVVLHGLIKRVNGNSTSNEIIATLPDGYRPSTRYLYQSVANSANARIDIFPNGEIRIVGAFNDLTLEGITFQPASTTFTNLAPYLSGWTTYGDANYAIPMSYAVDGAGRTEVRGMVSSGTATDGTDIVTMSSAIAPSEYYHLPAMAGGPNSTVGIVGTNGPTPAIEAKGGSNAWYSIHALWWPASRTTGSTCTTQWCSLTLQNGWVHYGSPFATQAYTKGSDNMVHLKGLIRSGTASQGTVLATLPAGYRPKGYLLFQNQNGGGLGRVDLYPNGNLVIVLGSNGWLSLDGIKFIAEQ